MESSNQAGAHVYDFMIFASAYPGDYGISRIMQEAANRLQLQGQSRVVYRGAFVHRKSADMERALLYDMLSRKRVNIMFLLPYDLFSVLSLMARYPEQKFILPYSVNMGQNNLPSNLKMAWIRLEQGAFLAGVIAGKMTRNNRIGMLIDMSEQIAEIPIYAFVQGIRQVNQSSKIVIVLTDSDTNMLENETTRMISTDGIDTMFAMSVNYNNIIIRSAYYFGKDVLLINSWYSADVEWPRHVITSLVISFESIMRNFMKYSGSLEDFDSLPPVKVYDLSDKNVMYFSWDNQVNTEFEIERPEYEEQSRQTREETTKWVKRLHNKEFVVFDALAAGMPPSELQDFYLRDSRKR